MSNANVHKNYTSSGNAEAEKLLDSVLKEMGGMLRGSGLSVYLGGSYGRGEGGVRQDAGNGILYNDLDFFVFARKAEKGAEKLLHEISEKYEEKLKVDVDFSRVMSIRDIKRNSRRLMMQELKRGYRLVAGEDLLEKYLQEYPADQLPFSEVCRLLLNRGMGLRFAQEKVASNSNDTDFILRNLNKAILGTGDALLIAQGKYCWRIAERLEKIENSTLSGEWKKLYAEAVRFKSSPSREVPEDLEGYVSRVSEFFQSGVLAVSQADSVENIRYGIWKKCRSSGEYTIFNLFRYCLKTRRVDGGISFLKMAPAAVVLCRLFDKDVPREQLLGEWQKFN